MVKQLQVEMLYGLTVESDISLTRDPHTRELPAVPDVTITELLEWQNAPFQPTHENQRFEKRDPLLQIYVQGEWFCLRYPGMADIFVRCPDQITFRKLSDASNDLLTSLLKGPAFAVLLELRGEICLHASAVKIGNRVVGFLGDSGQGKSTLAAEFVSHGYPLVTDDVLSIECQQGKHRVWPSFAELKLMPQQASHHNDSSSAPSAERCKQIQTPDAIGGTCTSDSLPLTDLFVLQRESSCDKARIEKLEQAEQFLQLSRYRFCVQASRVLGLSPSRFYDLGQLVQQVSVWRLRYGDGMEKLPRARRSLLHHFNVRQSLQAE